jgi:Leucine-rich repeat (LRR) protein
MRAILWWTFWVTLGCTGAATPTPEPAPAPEPAAKVKGKGKGKAKAPESAPIDSWSWWNSLTPCIQQRLLGRDLAPPKSAADMGPILGMQKLHIGACDPKITDIEWIRPLTQLTELGLSHAPIRDIRPLSDLDHLRDLALALGYVTEWPEDLALPELEALDLNTQIADLSAMKRQPKLKQLKLAFLPLDNLEFVRGLALEELEVESMDIGSLEPVASLKGLRKLSVGGVEGNDPAKRARLPLDMKPLVGLELTHLEISYRDITSPEALAQIVTLQEIDLTGSNVSSLAPFEHLPQLKHLGLFETEVPYEQNEAFRASHPSVYIADESNTGE